MALSVVAVVDFTPNGYTNDATAVACTGTKPTLKSSCVVAQHSQAPRGRGILPPCFNAQFFNGALSLKFQKYRSRLPALVGSSKIVASNVGFADHEAKKFREALLKVLSENQAIGDTRVQIADTCTQIFRQFAMSYSGKLPVEPFVEMRYALEEQGLPLSEVGKVTRAALGWSRYNLYHDWKDWSTAN